MFLLTATKGSEAGGNGAPTPGHSPPIVLGGTQASGRGGMDEDAVGVPVGRTGDGAPHG